MAQLKAKHSHKNKAFSGFGCFFIYTKINNTTSSPICILLLVLEGSFKKMA